MTEIRPETPTVKTFRLVAAGLAAAPRRPALRPAPDRRGRLPGAAQLLHRVGAERHRRGRADRRTPGGRRGLELPPRRAVVGDRIEVRGPIGGYFVWEGRAADPCCSSRGGSGVVPLMAMLRHRAAVGASVPATLLYSARSADELIYRAELDGFGAAASSSGRDAHALAAARLDRVCAAHRRCDALEWSRDRPRRAGLHLRADVDGRGGGRAAGGTGYRCGSDPNRAVRRDGSLRRDDE